MTDLPQINSQCALAVDVFLTKVKNNPQRYSDNISVTFCQTLIDQGGKQALGDFFAKLATAENIFQLELSEQEQEALRLTGEKKHCVQQLAEAGLGKNARETLLSRRTFFRALGGSVFGTALGSTFDSLSPTENPEYLRLQDELSKTREERDALQDETERLRYLYEKPEDQLTDAEKDELVQHTRAVYELNERTGDLDRALESIVEEKKEQVGFIADNPWIFTVGGFLLGVFSSLSGEAKEQSNNKFEAAIKALDEFCDVKLNRKAYSPLANTSDVPSR